MTKNQKKDKRASLLLIEDSLLTRAGALRALRKAGCSKEVIEHSKAVAREALRIAKRIRAKGNAIDLRKVELGGLLHDIGRSRTHNITHGIKGGEILRRLGLREFAGFAECHIGAGIPREEAVELGLLNRDFTPKSLEQKVVAYADKFVAGSRTLTYEGVLWWLEEELGPKHQALERFKALHEEIQKLMG